MSDDALWDMYLGAIIECEIDGRTQCLRGPNAEPLPADAPIFVLTAYNPGGVDRAEAENEADERVAGAGALGGRRDATGPRSDIRVTDRGRNPASRSRSSIAPRRARWAIATASSPSTS